MNRAASFVRFILLGFFLWGVTALVLRMFIVEDRTAWLCIAFAWVAAGYDTIRKHVLDQRKANGSPFACPKCGYDLRATPNRCPECGNVIKE